jgi:hypothetical protein
MEEGPITHPGVPQEIYHTLGPKTFWIFLLEKLNAPFIFLIVTVALFSIEGQQFLVIKGVGDITPYVNYAAEALPWHFPADARHRIASSRGSNIAPSSIVSEIIRLKIKRGVFTKEEVAIPYQPNPRREYQARSIFPDDGTFPHHHSHCRAGRRDRQTIASQKAFCRRSTKTLPNGYSRSSWSGPTCKKLLKRSS